MATWEDLVALKQAFPFAPAWGQAAFQRRGNVRASTPAQPSPVMGRRTRKPNVRLSSNEWTH
jgi:hypothetical protein